MLSLVSSFIKAQLEVMFSFNKYIDEQIRKNSVELDETLDKFKSQSKCSPSSLVVCKLDVGCDFSCQLQKMSTCLFLAHFTNRSILVRPNTESANSLLKYIQPSELESCSVSDGQFFSNNHQTRLIRCLFKFLGF